MTPGLNRLSHTINAARQLTQNARGVELAADVADEIAGRLREAARLLKGKAATVKPAQPSKPTRRRSLWRRDPRCFWCGRETDITTHNQDDSATVEHIYPKRHPKRRQNTRRHLPLTVLACYQCNHERGAPEPTTFETCPVLVVVKGSERAA